MACASGSNVLKALRLRDTSPAGAALDIRDGPESV
jgi:hypothetical protein